MEQKDLHFLPFDVYTRNSLSAQAVELIAEQATSPLKVIDFGGRSGEFGAFIPKHELSVIDIREPETEADQALQKAGRYWVATGIQTDFPDQAYDLATAFEVVEHLAPQERQPFLEEMYRVSRMGILVSAPVDTPFNDAAERSLNSFFERLTGKSHPWLMEHIENRPLPQAKTIQGYLKDLGAKVLEIPNNNTFLWSLLQYLAFTDCKYKLDIQKIYAVYNDHFQQLGDAQGPVYRYIYVALKPEFAESLKAIKQQLASVDLTGEKQLKMLDVILEEFVAQISSRASLIQQKDAHINNLNVLMHDKDVEQAHLSQELQHRNQDIHERQLVIANQAQQLQGLQEQFQNQQVQFQEHFQNQQVHLERLGKELGDALRLAMKKIEQDAEEINHLSYRVNRLQSQVDQKERTIEKLQHAVQDKEQHIRNIQPYFEQMQKLQHSFTFKLVKKFMGVGDKVYHDSATAWNILRFEGLGAFLGSLGRFVTGNLKEPIPQAGTYKDLSLHEQYQLFLSKQPPLDEKKIQSEIEKLKFQPSISIVVPVYNVKPEWLSACIQSVQAQLYPNWELCVYDDASTKKDTVECLKSWEGKDPRIKIGYGKQNLHICGATNSAIKLATGKYVGLLDNDDELTPDALFEVVKALNTNQEAGLVYSDEDKRDMDGRLTEPHFKPDFNLDLLLSINYISHFTVIRKDIGDRLGWMRMDFQGSQDYDLYLRVIEHTKQILHIPKVLYHWRKVPGSTAARYEDKKYVDKASLRALQEYLGRQQISGSVTRVNTRPPTFRVKREILKLELISIIIPFKDKVKLLQMCIPSILENTTYKNYEILLVSNNSRQPETFEYIRTLTKAHQNIRLLEHNLPFNFSEINNWAVKQAKGKYVLLMNNDIEVISPEWLSAMVEHIQRPEVGAVGAKLLYPDNRIQHAGVIVGLGGVAGHSHKYFPQENDGYFARVNAIQDLSACTAACLLVKKDLYAKVGGLDEKNLKIAFNDVDFCLKIRAAGQLIVYTPFASLYHHESISRGQEDTPEKQQRFQKEVLFMKDKYGEGILHDPYYNPNLSLDREDFSLAI